MCDLTSTPTFTFNLSCHLLNELHILICSYLFNKANKLYSQSETCIWSLSHWEWLLCNETCHLWQFLPLTSLEVNHFSNGLPYPLLLGPDRCRCLRRHIHSSPAASNSHVYRYSSGNCSIALWMHWWPVDVKVAMVCWCCMDEIKPNSTWESAVERYRQTYLNTESL